VGSRRFFVIWLALLVMASFPVLSVLQPPLADYPNHLARVYIWMSSASAQAVPHVQPVWALQPNMAFELIVGPLSQIVSLENAGRTFVVLTIASLTLGPAILGRVLWGRYTLWSFLPFLFVYNRLFFWGFLGYLFSLGMGFVLSSFWLKKVDQGQRISWYAMACALATLMLGLHLYAFAVFCIVITVLTFRTVDSLLLLSKQWILECAYRLSPVLVALGVFALGAPVFESNHSVAWGPWMSKVSAVVGLLVGPNVRTDLLLAVVTVLMLVGAFWLRLCRLSGDRYLLLGLAILLLLHLVMPTQLFSSYGADQRLPIAIALFVSVLVLPGERGAGRWQPWGLVGLLLLVAVRVLLVRQDWLGYEPIHKELMRSYQELPRQSSVVAVVGTSSPLGLPRIPLTEHAGYAVISRGVFWPGLFAYPIHGAQTIAFQDRSLVSPSIAQLQKIPLADLDDVVAGRRDYPDFDLRHISPCYRFIVVMREDGRAGNLPTHSVLGDLRFRGVYSAIYERSTHEPCD